MTTSPNADPDTRLRAKPSFEVAQDQYRRAVQDMATQVTGLVPGLSWQLKEDSWRGCGGDFVHTAGVQAYVYVTFSGPIPDDQWPAALQIVRDGAQRLGATGSGVLADNPGDHDVGFSGGDGLEIEFGTKAATILSAKSDCRLRQADLPTASTAP